jgi:hypothetical protein
MTDPEPRLDLFVELAFRNVGVGDEDGQKNYESADDTEAFEPGLH